MKRTIVAILPLLAPFAGCGDNTTDAGTMPDIAMAKPDLTMNPDLQTPPDMVFIPPPPPALGQQIDRMGRPAINTALVDPFDTLGNVTIDAAKNMYNAAQDPTKWDQSFHGSGAQHAFIAGNLAVLDGVNPMSAVPGDGCGDQVLADAAVGKGGTRYDALASVLADDELYVDTTQKTCGLYLGVEAKAGLGLPINDCGGRTPLEDVIDESYTLLTVGAQGIGQGMNGFTFSIGDGVASDADGMPNQTTFPFLGTPN